MIDPIGTVPVFIAVTSQYDERHKKWIAVRATLFSAMILVFFVVAGEIILSAMDIPLSAFQIFGGAVLFLFALTMAFGSLNSRVAKSERCRNLVPSGGHLEGVEVMQQLPLEGCVVVHEKHEFPSRVEVAVQRDE